MIPFCFRRVCVGILIYVSLGLSQQRAAFCVCPAPNGACRNHLRTRIRCHRVSLGSGPFCVRPAPAPPPPDGQIRYARKAGRPAGRPAGTSSRCSRQRGFSKFRDSRVTRVHLPRLPQLQASSFPGFYYFFPASTCRGSQVCRLTGLQDFRHSVF